MDDETRPGANPGIMLPIGPIILILVIFLVMRKRKKSQEDQEFSRIIDSIDQAKLPERSKEMMKASVADVRAAMLSIREMAGELRANQR